VHCYVRARGLKLRLNCEVTAIAQEDESLHLMLTDGASFFAAIWVDFGGKLE